MKTYLTIMTALLLGLAALGIIPAVMSTMTFAAPGSQSKPELWILFASVFSFPAVCVLAVIMAWEYHKADKPLQARLAIFLPLINLLGLALAVIVANYVTR